MGRLPVAWVVCVGFWGCHYNNDPWELPTDGRDGDGLRGCDGALFCTPPRDCDPVGLPGEQGCAFGDRCVWQIIAEEPEPIGRLECVPDGPQGLGEACTEAAVGLDDTCMAGMVCVSGTCRDICGFDGSTNAACAAGFSCTRIDGLFANGDDDPVAGVCSEQCDPLTQTQTGGDPCPTGTGCYVLVSQLDTIAVCASAGTVGHGQLIEGPAFANSCEPGAQPRRRDPVSMDVECGGLCRPTHVTTTTNMASEGGVEPDSCQTRWGAAPPSDGVNGESCRYWWAREPFEDLTPFSNTLGWCFRHGAFQYDGDGDQVPELPFPRCIDTTTGDLLPPIGNPTHDDSEYFWCAERTPPFAGAPRPAVRSPDIRADRVRR